MPARVPAPPTLDALPNAVAVIFDQAQSTTANHQKNIVALAKLQTDAATITESVQNGRSTKLIGERAFEDAMLLMISRVLPLKKGITPADRIMRFIGGFTKFINEKASEERGNGPHDEDEDTTASRFVARILKFLLPGCVAKDKNVRFRVLQCIAEMISHLGEIDEETYTSLRSSLMERIRDKEPMIRVQAILSLSKLAGSEDVSELEEGEPTILESLVEALSCDTSADVRRVAVVNLPLAPQTLSSLLSRARDVDAVVRKLVYAAVLEPHCVSESGSGIGFTHPRVLTIAQREFIVRSGLGDREESVKAAATKLLATWVDTVRASGVKKEEEDEDGIRGDIIAFLKLFDLAEGTVAEDALRSVFNSRVDIFDNVEFGDDYWKTLTPERSFLARVFVDHCIATKDNTRLESALPVVTVLVFRLQDAFNELVQEIQDDSDERLFRDGMQDDEEEEERARKEEERLDKEFAVGEMLKLAVNLDYADEIGRRKMFQLIRAMVSHKTLPESLVAHCLDVLRTLSPNERDLIMVVVEVIHEIRDPSDAGDELRDINDGESEFGRTPATARIMRVLPKSTSEETPEQEARSVEMDARCLSLCIGMLERVNGTFEENSTLEGILRELILPAVRSKEFVLRQKGLVSLGLCCLIARRMAINSFQLFVNQVQASPESLKSSILHIIFDILMVHEGDFLGPGSASSEKVVEFLLHLLENEESDKIQALLCVGISKLVLSGMITDERILKGLFLVYVSPETSDNQELRQCLSYFFPIYSYSSAVNQRRMAKIFIPLYEHLISTLQEWDEGQEVVTAAQVGLMFVDWTDPQKAAAIGRGQQSGITDDTIHVDLASDIVKALFNKDMEKDDKKALVQLLGKLYIPDALDDDKLRTLKLLTRNLRSRRPLRDAVSQNAFAKFDDGISKKFAKQLESFSEEEYRQLENLKDLFEFLDDIAPESEQEDVKPAKRTGKKRRSESVTTATTTTPPLSDRESRPPSPRKHKKGKAKRRRISGSDQDADSGSDKIDDLRSAPPAPTRMMPRRSAAAKAKYTIAESASSDEDDDEESDVSEVETRPRKDRTMRNEEPNDKPDALSDRLIDLTMVSSEEEEEDEEVEVDDIL